MDYQEILNLPKTIAIVGLSDDSTRPSYQIAQYLINTGYKIIPVNPTIDEVLGLKSYPNISSVPADIKIDIVDVFRRSEQVVPIVEDIIKSGRKPFIWFQEGVENIEAQKLAQDHNLDMVQNLCIMKTHWGLK
ncbi:MAG: CoA-binding protein [Candidatus Shapirobacteria bacterium]